MIWLIALSAAFHISSSLPLTEEEMIKEANFEILKEERSYSDDGSYSFSYETGNGIARSETWTVGKNGAMVSTGKVSYEMPNGEMFILTFIADENGYRPSLKFKPVAPKFPSPIPSDEQSQIDKSRLEDEAKTEENDLQKNGMDKKAKEILNEEENDEEINVEREEVNEKGKSLTNNGTQSPQMSNQVENNRGEKELNKEMNLEINETEEISNNSTTPRTPNLEQKNKGEQQIKNELKIETNSTLETHKNNKTQSLKNPEREEMEEGEEGEGEEAKDIDDGNKRNELVGLKEEGLEGKHEKKVLGNTSLINQNNLLNKNIKHEEEKTKTPNMDKVTEGINFDTTTDTIIITTTTTTTTTNNNNKKNISNNNKDNIPNKIKIDKNQQGNKTNSKN